MPSFVEVIDAIYDSGMDLARLRVLVAIAREGSVTGAAEVLHYAQPSVSHHLARLEAEVGMPLVQRAGRGIRLTDAGRVLAERAEEILGRVASARAEVEAHAGLQAGRLRIAAFPSALATLVPVAAARFATAHPGIELSLREAEPPEALTALRNGEVDLALAFDYDHGPVPADNSHLTTTPLLREPIYIVTSGHEPRSLGTYGDERWIAGCERCRAHLVAECGKAGFAPIIGYETDDFVAAQALVAAGLGITVLPGLALLAHRHQAVHIRRLPGDHRTVTATTYGKPPAPLPVQAFFTALAEAQATLPPWPRTHRRRRHVTGPASGSEDA
jgi:DNA-binding transcriptional LysR family regulator